MVKTKGSSILEILLFLPLAAMLTFVAIDGALFYTDKSALNDAVRAGLRAYKAQNSKLVTVDTDDPASFVNCQLLTTTNDSIKSSVIYTQHLNDRNTNDTFSISTSAVVISIDPTSGKQLSYNILPSSRCPNLHNPSPDLLGFIASTLASNDENVSSYAQAMPTSSSGPLYRNFALLIFSEAHAYTRSINPFITKKLLNGYFKASAYSYVIADLAFYQRQDV